MRALARAICVVSPRDLVRAAMGVLGAAISFFSGGRFGGSGAFDCVPCAVFFGGLTGSGFSSAVGTLGNTYRGENHTCGGIRGLVVVGLGFLASLGATLGDVARGDLASGLIHLLMALFNAVNA